MWRDGKMQNGRFKDESFGKSETKRFLEGAGKIGVTYKINGRNYIVLNGMVEAKAPSVLNAFVSPRIHNKFVDGLKDEKIYTGDLTYVLSFPSIKLRATAYCTQITDATKLISFYHDDYASMVNYSISHINERHLGVELGAEIKLGTMFSLVLAGNYGDYRYSSQAEVTMNAENGTDFEGDVDRIVYWKNFHVAGTPQVATTAGLKFNHKYWWVNINCNYFDKIYCLHLAEAKERYDSLLKEFNSVGILKNVEIWWTCKRQISSTLGKYLYEKEYKSSNNYYAGAFNCQIEHYSIIKQAYLRGYENILILEDDIAFIKDIEYIQKIINGIPKDYDILKLYDTYQSNGKYKIKEENSNLFIPFEYGTYGCSTLAYALSRKGMEYYIDFVDNKYVFADTPLYNYDSTKKLNYYVPNYMPFCLPKGGTYINC